MKKLFLLIVLAFLLNASYACPICGCGVGGFYIGLFPTYRSQFVGIRYQYAHYETHLNDDPTQFSHDYYSIAELYGGLTFGKKWQLLGFVPYHFNYQKTDDGIVRRNGLGDITALLNYKVWETSGLNKKEQHVSQKFWLGAGVKLPVGRYNVNFNDSANVELDDLLGDVNSQMGTGSLDFITNAMYNVHINKFGINTTVNYKMNTANNSHFRYGNRFAANSFAYYQTRLSNTIYAAPNVGLMYEHIEPNYLSNSKVAQTGGYAALGSAGVDVNFKKITVGTNVQLPFKQDYSMNQTQNKVRALLHLTYTF